MTRVPPRAITPEFEPFYKQVFTCKEKFCNNQFIPHWEMNDSDSIWEPGRLYCSEECEVWDRELGGS